LQKLPDISKWEIFINIDENKIMQEYESLYNRIIFKDDFNFSAVTKMPYIDVKTKHLKSEISISSRKSEIIENLKSNIFSIKAIFSRCALLDELPNISNWKTDKITSICCIFSGCCSLTSLPNISNLKINKIKDMNGIFYECSSLNSLPDISSWNTENVEDMSSLFSHCDSLKYLPDISK
jgi:surface protein